MAFVLKSVPNTQKEWPCGERFNWVIMIVSFFRNYAATPQQRHHFFFFPFIQLLAMLQVVPTCCSVLTTLSMPKRWEAEQQELASHRTKPSESSTSLNFTVLPSYSIFTTIYQRIGVPRARVFALGAGNTQCRHFACCCWKLRTT